ncbi:MAG: divergent PAP2 family protein, partial [Candidatus Omnitrophica bacterium]|nr:divergent PAP2 family protein [Candidatus Omnitrophota bacterium]
MELSANSWTDFFRNPVIFSGFWGWFIAQCMKVALGIVRERRFNFKWFVGSGGMPSSHASLVMAMSTAVGIRVGFISPLYAVAAIFAFIT